MVLKIKLGLKREKRLKKHLEKEHPSTKGRTSISKYNSFTTTNQIKTILNSSPKIKCQAVKFTQV